MRPPLSVALLGALASAAGVLALGSDAAAKGDTEDDVSLSVYLYLQSPTDTKTRGLNFPLNVIVESGSGVRQTVVVRVALPSGLSWGRDAPDPTEGCTTDSPSVCTAGMEANTAGTVGTGWIWDVVAAAPGFYEVTASVQTELTDPNPANNSKTFRFEVVALDTGGGGGGSGGGSGGGGAAVVAGAVKLTPARPKAGSLLAATVRVSAAGSPVRPSRVSCTATAGGTKVRGAPKAAVGAAVCRYRPPRAAKGRVLRGALAVTARGKHFTKRFATKLG